MELELELDCAESGNRMIEPLQLMVDDRDTVDGAVAWELGHPSRRYLFKNDGFIFRHRLPNCTNLVANLDCLKLL